jgi:hypothetical protein
MSYQIVHFKDCTNSSKNPCLTNRWQCTMIDQSAMAIGHIQTKTWDVFWLAAGYHSVNNYECVIDTHVIFVRVVRSIQTACIKYSIQKCSLTLAILIIIWNSIILLFQFNWDIIYSAIIHVSDVSDDTDGIFACWVQRRSQRPLSTKHQNLRHL